ncbi:ligand-binding sensor domain-containing protein [Actinocorallia populi]|uniref:hypothetical protein n=1 Tax=Actinocorallia populi TaxID=2079200 RepID=UPI0013009F99|nr:hypothetical protein [Actinocorallia populi]
MRKWSILAAGMAAVVVALPSAAHAAPGDDWRSLSFLPIQGIHDFEAAGPAEVWHVAKDYKAFKGAVPAIFQWTGGSSWKRHSPPGISDSGGLNDVMVRDADEVWVAGSASGGAFTPTYLARYDGREWSQVPPPQPADDFGSRVLESDGAGAWLAEGARVSRWDGTSWTVVATLDSYVHRIQAFGPDNAWIGTRDNVLWHWDGSSWQQVPKPAEVYGAGVRFEAGGAWAATPRGMQSWDGSSWRLTPYPAPFDGAASLNAEGLAGSDGRWVRLYTGGDERGLLRWDGSGWTVHPMMPDGIPQQVVVDDAGRTWGVTRIFRSVGLPPRTEFQYKGRLLRFKDGAWENVSAPEADYRLIHLPGGDSLYGAGGNSWNDTNRVITNH